MRHSQDHLSGVKATDTLEMGLAVYGCHVPRALAVPSNDAVEDLRWLTGATARPLDMVVTEGLLACVAAINATP